MAPLAADARVSFPTSATKTQLVVFYVGLSTLGCILTASCILLLLRISGCRRSSLSCLAICCRRWSQSGKHMKRHESQNSKAASQQSGSDPVGTPAWAVAYRQHFDSAASECKPKRSLFDMPMLRTPRESSGLATHGGRYNDQLSPLPGEVYTRSKEHSDTEISRVLDSTSSCPVIIVECDDTSYRSLEQGTVFPISPVLTSQKCVIDYLSVPSPHWFRPDVEFEDAVFAEDDLDATDIRVSGEASSPPRRSCGDVLQSMRLLRQ